MRTRCAWRVTFSSFFEGTNSRSKIVGTFLAVLELLRHPTESPYGNPIPGLEELGETDGADPFLDENMVSLADLKPGQTLAFAGAGRGRPASLHRRSHLRRGAGGQRGRGRRAGAGRRLARVRGQALIPPVPGRMAAVRFSSPLR